MLTLKTVRKEKNLSVSKLSAASGVPIRTIEDAEARGDCRMSTATKLAEALEVRLDDLWVKEKAGESENSHL